MHEAWVLYKEYVPSADINMIKWLLRNLIVISSYSDRKSEQKNCTFRNDNIGSRVTKSLITAWEYCCGTNVQEALRTWLLLGATVVTLPILFDK